MIRKICGMWLKRRTKNFTLIPLFTVTFDYQKFRLSGKEGSCAFYSIHPDIHKDEFLHEKLRECVDYIRNNYDMEQFTKI